jgi:protoheme IX farnesyltransferase
MLTSSRQGPATVAGPPSQEVPHQPRQAPGWLAGFASSASSYLRLTKPRIIELLLVTALPPMEVAAKGAVPAARLLGCLVGGYLTAGGANAANMVLDKDIDSVMVRTRRRPLVRREVTTRSALAFAVAIEAIGVAVLWTTCNWQAAALALAAALFYVFVYTAWLKRRTTQNIVIGGAAGAAPPLVGWVAVTGHVSPAALVMFAVVFFWTPPHFWALAVAFREDYARAGVPMLPVKASTGRVGLEMLAYSLLTAACAISLPALAPLGALYEAVAALGSAAFVGACVAFLLRPSRLRALLVFRLSILFLAVVFVAMFADVLLARP